MNDLQAVAAVAAGGAAGALLRWWVARLNRPAWPVGTLVANVIGTVLLGLLIAVDAAGSAMILLGGGIAGGLTTFSTVMNEVVAPADHPRRSGVARRATYLTLTVGLGLTIGAVAVAWR